MRLIQLVQRFTRVRIANRGDNAQILQFIGQSPTDSGSIVFLFDRNPDFFKYLDCQGQPHFVFIFQNDDKTIGGIAAVLIKKHYLNGILTPTLYLADVRIDPKASRKTRLEWRQFYAELVQESGNIDEFLGCSYVYTLVMDANKTGLAAFQSQKRGIRYIPISKCNHVYIMGSFYRGLLGQLKDIFKKNQSQSQSNGFSIDCFKMTDEQSLRKFLFNQNKNRFLGSSFTQDSWRHDDLIPRDELQRRLNTWESFSLSRFLISKNKDGEVIGCVCPVDFESARRLIIKKAPLYLRVGCYLASYFSHRAIVKNKPLRILNLTHFEVDETLPPEKRQCVYSALLDKALSMASTFKKYHMVGVSETDPRSLEPALGKYFLQRSASTLYRVVVSLNPSKKSSLAPAQQESTTNELFQDTYFEIATS